jgi:hypothetical protein
MKSLKYIVLSVLTAFAITTTAAFGQQYPSRAVTIIVPFAAGGPTDTLARILAQRMTLSLGSSRYDRGRAGGSLGARRIYIEYRPHWNARHQRRDLSVAIRSSEGSRAPVLIALNASAIYLAVGASGGAGALLLRYVDPHVLPVIGAALIASGFVWAEMARNRLGEETSARSQ